MTSHHQTTGGFIRSSASSVFIIGNLLFSLIFLCALGFHIMQSKETSVQSLNEKPQAVKTAPMVTLASIQ